MPDHCDHSDDRATCPVCQRSTAPRVNWSRPFTARYEGECAGCPNGIDVGEVIRGCAGEYRHEECV